MALKPLLLRKRLTDLRSALDSLRAQQTEMEAREAELEADIEAASTDEERTVVEEAVNNFEEERSTLEGRISATETEISNLEEELRAAEAEAAERRGAAPAAAPAAPNNNNHERMSNMPINTRATMFGATHEQRSAFFAREEVKTFLQRVRELRTQQSSVSGSELGIPDAFLGILRDEISRYSKLLKHVTVKQVKGKARQNIAGKIPEAIWTEAVKSLNKLNITFNQVEMDGYKVGGYIVVPNSDLDDDSDLNLAVTVVDSLGQSIGYAVDKAIVYGTGEKMPVGFITRLAATQQPSWWGNNQGDFTDLSQTNILKLDLAALDGVAFFRPLLAALGLAKPNYSNGKQVYVMNHATHMDLVSRALTFTAAGPLVAGMSKNEMPVNGGIIEELDFMADGDIGGGYLSLEVIAEREGASMGNSDQVFFIQDSTVFKGSGRYDGKPVFGEGFIVVNYKNQNPTTSVSFELDYANEEIGKLIVVSAAGTAAGTSKITVSGAADGATLKYALGSTYVNVTNGKKLGANWTSITSGSDIEAATGDIITVCEVDAKGKAIKTGFAFVTAKA